MKMAAHTESGGHESKMEELIDRMLDLALHKIKNDVTQPFVIADTTIEFKKKFLCLSLFNAKVVLRNGKLWGIDTITRPHSVDFEYNDPLADVKSDVSVDSLKFSFEFQITINRRMRAGTITGNVSGLVSNAGFQINFDSETIKLTQAELKNVKKLGIRIDSREFSDKFLNFVFCVTTATSRFAILYIIENRLQKFVGLNVSI